MSFFLIFMLLVALCLFFAYSPESVEVVESLISSSVPVAPQAPILEEVIAPVVAESSAWASYTMIAGGVLLVGAGLYFGLPFILPFFVTGEVVQELASEVSSVVGSIPLENSSSEGVFSFSSSLFEEASSVSSSIAEAVPALMDVASAHPTAAMAVAAISSIPTLAITWSPQLSSPVQESHLPVLGLPTVKQTIENLKSLGPSLFSVAPSAVMAPVTVSSPFVVAPLSQSEADISYAQGLTGLIDSIVPLPEYEITEQQLAHSVATMRDKAGAQGSPMLVKKALNFFPNPQGTMNLLSWRQLLVLHLHSQYMIENVLVMGEEAAMQSAVAKYPEYPSIMDLLEATGIGEQTMEWVLDATFGVEVNHVVTGSTMMLHDILLGYGTAQENADMCQLLASALTSFVPHTTSPEAVKSLILNHSEVRRVMNELIRPSEFQLK